MKGLEGYSEPIENIETSNVEKVDLSDTENLSELSPFELHGRLTALTQTIQALQEVTDALPAGKRRQAMEEIAVLEHQVGLIKGYLSPNENSDDSSSQQAA